MGKGAGSCDQRPSLSLLAGSIDDASKQAKTELGNLQRWSKETDEDKLLQSLHNTHGLEHWVIAERLREIRTGKARDLGWGEFRLEHILSKAPENQSFLYPIFFQDSLLKDGVGYFEYCNERRKQNAKTFKAIALDADMPKDWEYKGPLTKTQAWQKVKSNVFAATTFTTVNDSPTPEEILQAIDQSTSKQKCIPGSQIFSEEILQAIDQSTWQGNLLWKCFSKEQKQELCQSYAKQLKGKKSVISKHWDYHPEATWRFHAEVEPKQEESLIKAFIRNGATVEDNEMEVPDYDSVHDLSGGKAYRIAVGKDGYIQYVPHYSVGTKERVYTDYNVVWTPAEEQLEEIKEKTRNHYENTKAENLENLLIRVREYPDGKKTSERVVPLSLIPEKYQEKAKKHAESGEEMVVKKEGKGWTEHLRFASEEDMKNCPVYSETENGKWLFKKHAEAMDKQLKAIEDLGKQTWSWKWNDVDAGAAPRFHKSPQTPQEKAEMKAFTNLDSRIRQTAKQNGWPYGMVRLMTKDDGTLRESIKADLKNTTKIEKIPHNAPLSERGCIKSVGVHPEKALDELRRLDAVDKVQKQIPWKMLYSDNSCKGRVLPMHKEYATAESALTIPEDKFVIHGMTGVSNDSMALERFEKILKTGSLKSIAERRRVGIIANSLSPKGDIASGIDGGVPCTIASAPSFGSHVSFVMKPEVLARRDVWFSNVDFGGGHNRYDEYNYYAQSLGQKKMHEPPSDKARQKHYKSGLDSMNEVYFKHEIPWHHIDRIFVSSSIYEKVLDKVKQAKKQGTVPSSLKIEKSTDTGNGFSAGQFLQTAGKSYKNQLKNGIYSGPKK